jgi:hypothetical protein
VNLQTSFNEYDDFGSFFGFITLANVKVLAFAY